MKILGASCGIFLTLLINAACSDTKKVKVDLNLPDLTTDELDLTTDELEIRSENTGETISLPPGYEDLIAKSEIEKNASKYSLMTTTYLNSSENTSRIEDTEQELIELFNSPFTNAEDLIFPTNFKYYNSLAVVGFTSNVDPKLFTFNDTVLRDLDILGEENTNYPLRLRLTESYLIIEKIVTESQLATIEKTTAKVLENNTYAAVLAGYPIEKYSLEYIKSIGAPIVIPVVAKLAEADFIRINKSSVQKFRKVDKVDVFPVELFPDGKEYFYAKTVVDRPYVEENVELPTSFELGMQWQSSRVRIRRTEKSIQFIDVSSIKARDVEGKEWKILLEIPVEWKDYQILSINNEETLAEIEINKFYPDEARPWDQRKWVHMKFNRADNKLEDSNNLILKRLELAENYFGFEVFESKKLYKTSTGSILPRVTFKYSLKGATKNE